MCAADASAYAALMQHQKWVYHEIAMDGLWMDATAASISISISITMDGSTN